MEQLKIPWDKVREDSDRGIRRDVVEHIGYSALSDFQTVLNGC